MQKLIPFISLTLTYSIGLTVGIFGIRFFGQGLLPVISNTMLGKWFQKKRGRAFSVMGIFVSLAFANAPVVMNALVNRLGWALSWRYIAIFACTSMTLIGWLFFRDKPESCGLKVDGDSADIKDKESTTKATQPSGSEEQKQYLLKEAKRTLPYWSIAIVLCTTALVATGIYFHIVAIGKESGIGSGKVLSIFIPIAFLSIPIGFLCSFLSDYIRLKYVIILMAFGQLLAFFSFIFFAHTVGFILVIVGLGISSGCFGPVMSLGLPYFFGRDHLGTINSSIVSYTVIGSALGPYYFSLLNDRFGTFTLPIVICAIFPLAAIIMATKIKQ